MNKEASIAKSERKMKNKIGSHMYTVFVMMYTVILFAAIFYPQVLPLGYFSKYEVFPQTDVQMKAFWRSFGTFDPVYYGLVYLVATAGGYYFMKGRERLRLLWSQRFWNLFVAIFSIWSSIRLLSYVLQKLSRDGTASTLRPLTDIICDTAIGDVFLEQSPAGFYTVIFIFSKYAEFIDTFFIVVHKKPLITLHWWHHFSASVLSMHVGMTQLSCGWFFALMNLPVHGYMYTYYAFASFGYRPAKWAISITKLQIMQMVGGLFITSVAIYAKNKKPGCVWQDPSTNQIPLLTFSLFIYGSYFVLFSKFYIDRYLVTKRKTS